MERKRATLEEIIATFSNHVSRNYPSPADFRRNFDILLWGKRDRDGADGYAGTLEKNIVYLDGVIDEALSLAGRFLGAGEAPGEKELAALLGSIETGARRATGKRHERAFVKRDDPLFCALAEGREALSRRGRVPRREGARWAPVPVPSARWLRPLGTPGVHCGLPRRPSHVRAGRVGAHRGGARRRRSRRHVPS